MIYIYIYIINVYIDIYLTVALTHLKENRNKNHKKKNIIFASHLRRLCTGWLVGLNGFFEVGNMMQTLQGRLGELAAGNDGGQHPPMGGVETLRGCLMAQNFPSIWHPLEGPGILVLQDSDTLVF